MSHRIQIHTQHFDRILCYILAAALHGRLLSNPYFEGVYKMSEGTFDELAGMKRVPSAKIQICRTAFAWHAVLCMAGTKMLYSRESHQRGACCCAATRAASALSTSIQSDTRWISGCEGLHPTTQGFGCR